MSHTMLNFVRQQGFANASGATCDFQYPALMFQPRLIGVIVITGVVFQSAPVFLVLSAVLWWNALVPRFNPFDWLHNAFIAARKGRPPLTPAPAPRRFAQAMAAAMSLLIGVSLRAEWNVTAWIVEALLLLAIGLLVFGSFCVGSFTFHLLTGRLEFAKRTMPWVR